jgi:hypothetical protein
VTILLEEGINTRNTAVPAIFQIFNGETTILGICLLPLHGILKTRHELNLRTLPPMAGGICKETSAIGSGLWSREHTE